MRRLATILTLGCAFAAGCGGGDEPTPEDEVRSAVRAYLTAVAESKPEEACAQLTRGAQQALSEEVSAAFADAPRLSCPEAARELSVDVAPDDKPILLDPVIESVRVQGDRATAEVQRMVDPVPLVRVGDEWRVDRSTYELER